MPLSYRAITGSQPPTKPPTAERYARAGLPWFDYYDAEQKALKGSKRLAGLDSLAARFFKKGKGVLPDNAPVDAQNVKAIGTAAGTVREGKF